jgi:hypothetical protein
VQELNGRKDLVKTAPAGTLISDHIYTFTVTNAVLISLEAVQVSDPAAVKEG